MAGNLIAGLGKTNTDSVVATADGWRYCNVCGTKFAPGTPSDPHFEDDKITFADGCMFTNRRCTRADVWIWSYLDDGDNPHGHELPVRWPHRLNVAPVPTSD